MWFSVAPVTPPHVRRRAERYQQEHPEQQQQLSGGACSPRGASCSSPSPRARSLPLATSRRATTESKSESRAAHLSPREHVSASSAAEDCSDGKDRSLTGRRRQRAPMQSPRRNDRVALASLSVSDQSRQQDDEEPDAPPMRELAKSRGWRQSNLEQATDRGNQLSAGEPALNSSGWSSKEQEGRDPDAVDARLTSVAARLSSSSSSTTRPKQESPNPAMPRSRRASRRFSRGDAAAIASAIFDTPVTPHGGSLLPFLSRIGERCSFSRGIGTAAASAANDQSENLVGHVSSVCALATSDDRVLVSCSRDGLVKIWSRVSFNCLQTLSGHDDNVSCVDIRGEWLVSGSHDATLRLYRRHRRRSTLATNDTHAGGPEFELHCVFRGHTGHVTKVHLPETLPGLVLSCSDDATLRLWSAELAQCVLVLSLHTSRVTCFTVYLIANSSERAAATGDYVVCSGAADAAVCFWEILSGTQANQRDGEHGSHGDLQIVRSRACHAHRSTVQCVAVVASEDAATSATAVSASATPLLVSGSNNGTIQLFNLLNFEHLAQLYNCKSPVYTLAAAPTDRLVCSTRDGRLLVFSDVLRHCMAPPRSQAPTELKVAPTWLPSLQLRGDLVVCCGEDTLYIVSISPGAEAVVRAIETKHSFINCVRWVHSRAVITCGQDNVIKLWNIVL